MKDDDNLFLSVAELAQRGWTEALINRFLGEPDRWKPVDHWRNASGMRSYFLERVQNAESREEVHKALLDSARRRKLTRKQLIAFAGERERTKDAVQLWRDSLTDGERQEAAAIEKAAELIEEARRRGLKTPHSPRGKGP